MIKHIGSHPYTHSHIREGKACIEAFDTNFSNRLHRIWNVSITIYYFFYSWIGQEFAKAVVLSGRISCKHLRKYVRNVRVWEKFKHKRADADSHHHRKRTHTHKDFTRKFENTVVVYVSYVCCTCRCGGMNGQLFTTFQNCKSQERILKKWFEIAEIRQSTE